jgi:hypothetical protein
MQNEKEDYDLESIAEKYTKLADAEIAAGHLTEAKGTAAAALRLARIISDGDYRARVLDGLAKNVGKLALSAELSTLSSNLPSSYHRDDIFASLALGYAESRDITNTIAAAGRIADADRRKSALSEAIAHFVQTDDWQGALRLANDKVLSSTLHASIAKRMLAAGRLQEAAALEPKFAASNADADDYLDALAVQLASSGQFDRAAEAALRRSSLVGRLQALRGVEFRAEELAGRAAAKAVFDRAIAQLGRASGAERDALCKELANFGVSAGNDGVVRALAATCLVDAVAIRNPLDRTKLWSALLVRQTQPNRFLLGQWFAAAEAAADPYERRNAADSGFSLLTNAGAAETYVALANTSHMFDKSYLLAGAAKTLAEAGNVADARVLLRRVLADTESAADRNGADSGYLSAIGVLIALDDLDGAAALVPKITAVREQFRALSDLASAASRKGKKEQTIAFIQQALQRLRSADSSYTWQFVGLAAQVGALPLAESLLGQVPAGDLGFARSGLVRALLKDGQKDKAVAAIPALEAMILKQRADRPWNVTGFATLLAWADDTSRIEKLIASATEPGTAASILVAASDGYAKGGNAEAAQQSLARALGLLHINREDFASWTSYRIALAEVEVDQARASSRALAISDADWRDRAVIALADRSRPELAVKLLRAIQPSALADKSIPRIIPALINADAVADARLLIGRITDPELRDRAQGDLVLRQARRGQTESAVSDVNTVQSVTVRAYVLLDLAALFGLRNEKTLAENAMVAASRAAASISDTLVKSDVLTGVSRIAALIGGDIAEPAKRKALEAARGISDEPIRVGALRWAEDINLAELTADHNKKDELADAAKKKVEKLKDDVRSEWGGYIRHSLDDKVYTDIDVFVRSLASRPPREAVSSLAEAAGKYGSAIRKLRDMSAAWATREAATR